MPGGHGKLKGIHWHSTRRAPRYQAAAMTAYPVTVIIRSPRENPKKCSVLPLRGRPDLLFLTHPVAERPPLECYICLAAEGPPLSAADGARR